MKKSRKILSVFLAVMLAFGSMPMMYTATTASEIISYDREVGTIDKPMSAVSKEGTFKKDDLYKVNVNASETTYHFYQKVDDEYFTYTQAVGFQQVRSGASDRTVTFVNVSDYTGASSVNGNADGATVGTQGYYETPVITSNGTADFIKTSNPTTTWTAINDNAKRVVSDRETQTPENFDLEGSDWDATGCRVYGWHNTVVFKGADANSVSGTQVYYKSYNYKWVPDGETTENKMDLRIGTTIDIVDAREFYEEIKKAENIIDYPHKYTDAYVSSVTAAYNSIPDGLKDFSVYYSQADVDKYTQILKDISRNSADYSVYNQYFEELSKLDNHTGSWTENSFNAFKAEIAQIDANLSKSLDKTQQATVDAAVQALIAAYEKLISTDVTGDNDKPYNYTSNGSDGDMYFSVNDTEFKFMQTEDDQIFEYSQLWTIKRDGGSTARKFKGMILETGYPLTENSSKSTCYGAPSITENKTSEFINILTDSSKTTITADNEYQSVTATEFACWWEYQADGTANVESTFVDAEGTLDSNRDFEYSDGKTYYLKNSPQIKGNPAGTYGSVAVNYVLRTGWTYKTGGFIGIGGTTHAAHIHVNSTVEITDVRQLIAAVDSANAIIANPENYTDNYITALKSAVGAVPQYMLHGSEFYTQAEVDKLTTQITGLLNNPNAQYADYSEFNKTFDKLSSVENSGKYTPESYEAFQKEIYTINSNLDKTLTSDQQSVVDSAVDALNAAASLLEFRHLNDDIGFTDTNIADSLGNSPVAFDVSSVEYNFMQTLDGQEFVIKTDLTARNTRSSYKSKLLSLKISQLDKNSLNVCAERTDPDTGCHYGENVLRNDYQTLLANITSGLNVFSAANEAGDIAEFNTWQNVSGVALSSGGIIIDGVQLDGNNSTASAVMTYKGETGGAEDLTSVNLQYALRLGWSYQEVVLGVEGDSTSRHAHIPVAINITDARALKNLYEDSMDAVSGKTDETYTLATLEELYAVLTTIPTDMVYGEHYYTQDQVNEQYNKLKETYDTLKEGADYSDYFAEQVKADKVIASGNTDNYNNKLYPQDAYDNYVNSVTEIMNGLDKNLDATPENQATIDAATQGLKDALATLNENKLADYSKLSDAMEKANEILTAPEGTYTDETIEAVTNALNTAKDVPADLPASEQATVDAAADSLQNAIDDALFRADYSEYEAAKAVADAINNDNGLYTDKAYAAFKEKIAEIDAGLDKNLPDYAVNRQTIATATQAINDAITELNNNKKGDYTEYNNTLNNANSIVNDDGNGNTIYNPEAFEAFKNTLTEIDKLDKDLTEHEQGTIDSATQEIINAQNTLEENRWADYTELEANKALVQEILDAPEGTYTDSTIAAAQQAMDAANQIPNGLVVGKDNEYQNQIDSAAAALKNVYDSKQEKADYSALESAMNDSKLQEILNAPEGTYTDSTIKAVNDALAAAEALDKDLPKSEQATVNSVANALQSAIDSAQIKADYSEFNATKAELQEIVDAPEGTYTDATVNAAQEALNTANGVNNDLPDSNQPEIDAVTDAMQNVIDNAQKKADYTEYDNTKTEIENIINAGNTDENGDKIYDDAVFEELKNTLTEVDANLNKDLPDSQQGVVDTATSTLEDIKTKLENSKIYTATFIGEDGTTILATVDYTNGTLLKNIAGKPALPEGTDVFKYIGWATADNTLYTDESAVTGDITLYVAGEFVKIAPNADSTLTFDEEKGIVTGIDKNTTVSTIKTQLENDLTYIEIKDFTGKLLADEELVGTGSTITLKSKYTGAIYETKTIIIYGDVDGDGDVDNDDYTLAKKVNVGELTYTAEQNYFFIANDVNGDGFIDVLDSYTIALIKRGKLTIV